MTGPYDDEPPWEDEPAEESRRHSWSPVDLEAVLAGDWQRPEPTVGARSDGPGLFYPGRMHTIAGESEGGKTWLALAQARVELDRGHGVAYLDFEDDEGGVVGRLQALGVTAQTIRERFAYLRPDEPISAWDNAADLGQAIGDLQPTLVVLDGVTEAMTLHGLDPLSNKDAATFGRLVPRRIADAGPATCALDHVTKAPEGRGRYALGAVHKLNGLNGAAYLAENRTPFGIGTTGRSTIRVAKDRPGGIRRHALPSAGSTHWFADLVLNSHAEDFVEAETATPTERDGTFRPTVLMRRVSDCLADKGPLAARQVEQLVTGKAAGIRQAITHLQVDGYVTQTTPLTLIRPFAEEDPT